MKTQLIKCLALSLFLATGNLKAQTMNIDLRQATVKRGQIPQFSIG